MCLANENLRTKFLLKTSEISYFDFCKSQADFSLAIL